MLVLPVVVEQLGEDGEVEEGEDEADCLEGDLLDLFTVGWRTELTPVYVDHLDRDLSQNRNSLHFSFFTFSPTNFSGLESELQNRLSTSASLERRF